MSIWAGICAAGILGAAANAGAQTLPLPLPKVLLFPNYDNVLVGTDPALEGGAYVARASDAAANFYNAAGLVKGERTTLNASSNGYLVMQIDSKALGTSQSGTNVDNLPGFIGVLFGAPFIGLRNLRLGFSVARLESWTPPGIDQSVSSSPSDVTSRTTYSSSSSFRTLVYQGAIAWSPMSSRAVRLGLTLGLAETALSWSTQVSGQLNSPSGPDFFLSSIGTSGTEWDVVPGLSAQWDVWPWLTVAARGSAPGVKLGSSSLVTYQGNEPRPGASISYFFRDDGGAFRFKRPWDASAGVAFRFGPTQFEADVRYHAAIGTYDLYRSTKPLEVITHHPDGTTTSSSTAGPTLVYAAQQVTNFALGGDVRITRTFTAHGGFYTSFSPVEDPEATPLRSADLYGLTGGVDLQLDRFGFSIGIGYQFGSSQPSGLAVGDPSLGLAGLSIRAISILYAFSYQF